MSFTYAFGENMVDGEQYLRVLDPNKIAELNDADLIIIARDCASGRYSDPNEAQLWNSIATPIIMQGPHIARALPKWGWFNSTGTDAGAGVSAMQVVDPNDVVQWYDPNAASGYASFMRGADAGNGKVLAVRPDNGNMLIAEWAAGQETYAGSGQIPVDVRVLFSAGTQEISGQKTNWGVMNLNAEGQKVFLNAVAYLITPPVEEMPGTK